MCDGMSQDFDVIFGTTWNLPFRLWSASMFQLRLTPLLRLHEDSHDLTLYMEGFSVTVTSLMETVLKCLPGACTYLTMQSLRHSSRQVKHNDWSLKFHFQIYFSEKQADCLIRRRWLVISSQIYTCVCFLLYLRKTISSRNHSSHIHIK